MLHDLRSAFRALRRHPGATLVSLAVLSLGIGAATAIFSLYHALLLRPLGIQEPGRILRVQVQHPGREPRDLCALDLADLDRSPGLLEHPFGFSSYVMRVQGPKGGRTVLASALEGPGFACLRPKLAQGVPSPEGLAVSQDLFEALFGSETHLEGQTLRVSGVELPISAVVARGFHGLEPGMRHELWIPPALQVRVDPVAARVALTRDTSGGGRWSFARLRAGATSAQAEASLAGLAATWAQAMPETHGGVRLLLRPLRVGWEQLWAQYLPQRRLLGAALALLGLLGALNVVQLQVAHWLADRRELATRMALGAPRGALLREQGFELLLLVLASGALALPAAWGMTRWLERLQPPREFPLSLDVTPDLAVLGFGLLLLGLLALLMGGLALLWLRKDRSAEVLRAGAGTLGGKSPWRRFLLAFQLALALGLLGTALPVLSNLHQARQVDLGFQPKGVYAVSFAPPWFLDRAIHMGECWARLVDRLQAQQPVTGAALPPLEAFPWRWTMQAEDGRAQDCLLDRVHPGFLETLGVPMREGRTIGPQDTRETPLVAVVDETMAKALWPGRSALGRTLLTHTGKRLTVVGVCAPFRLQDPLKSTQPLVLGALRQSPFPLFSLLVRSDLPEAQLRAWLEREAAQVEPRLAILRTESLTERLDRHLQPLRLASSLLGALSLLALVLAAAGTYGLQSLLAAQRTREFGLRAALGSSRSGLVFEALRATLQPALAGAGGGFALAWALRRSLAALLGPLGQPATSGLLVGALILLGTALAAALLPALRAARVAPAEALRSE